ncbi:hypothetical protein [Geothermobacter hydrogeniphilus]|uniref:Uncharacterized protein n=1 Tax=Geothermobacter hydrogeniphilus TaxID=1969733 RepID=A0A1X0Y5B8_9BACT|nr:hypothetical protein [Geothermobacter hydrogeniphilus]ORJ60298.1 hypothetical protein B5V00_08585 [Geothermobacter hydrogeniphilus]
MTASRHSTPTELLGLPDPDTARFSDPLLTAAYREFCGKLEILPGNDAVLISRGFHFGIADKMDRESLAHLKLGCALLRPAGRFLKHIKSRTYDVERYAERHAVSHGHIYEFGVANALRLFVDFPSTDDYALLTGKAIQNRGLFSVGVSYSSAPGFDWHVSVSCVTWSRKWGLILDYGDSESGQTYAFPGVVGFFRRDQLLRSAARLLAHAPDGVPADEGEFWGCLALRPYWVRWTHPDWKTTGRHHVSPGIHLLELEENDLKRLTRKYELDEGWFPTVFEQLWSLGQKKWGLGPEDNPLKRVVDEYGSASLTKLDKIVTLLQDLPDWDRAGRSTSPVEIPAPN